MHIHRMPNFVLSEPPAVTVAFVRATGRIPSIVLDESPGEFTASPAAVGVEASPSSEILLTDADAFGLLDRYSIDRWRDDGGS